MKQFYETYVALPKLATLLREVSWSKHLLLLSQCKSEEEKEFYLLSATRAHWSHRELERQIKKSAFERTMLSQLKLATASRVLPQNATGVFKDSYLVDFLDLPDTHSELICKRGSSSIAYRSATKISNWIYSSIIETCSAWLPSN
jgi:hypothetical protein